MDWAILSAVCAVASWGALFFMARLFARNAQNGKDLIDAITEDAKSRVAMDDRLRAMHSRLRDFDDDADRWKW